MKRLARFWEQVRHLADSPSFLRDWQSLSSPWRIGVWLLILNLTLGLLLGSTVFWAAVQAEPGVASICDHLGLGQYLACMLMLGLGALCTLLVPVRAAGLFEGPRWGRYFDQVILSGISPARYFAGKVVALNAFFGCMVGAALPYAIFALSLGGTRAGYVVTALGALWLYVNLLTVATLLAGAFYHEVQAALATVLLFGFAFAFGLGPLPPIVGFLTPAHYAFSPFWDALVTVRGNGPPWALDVLVVPLGGAALRLGSATCFFLGAGGGLALLGTALLLGPVHCLTQVNSAFGEVVMPGDNRRSSLLRRRFQLRRRSEMSFFYENRSPWLTRYEAPLRYGVILVCLVGLASIAFGLLHAFASEFSPEDFYIANLVTAMSAIFVAAVVFTSDKGTLLTPMRAGRRCHVAWSLDLAGFLCFGALVVAVADIVPALRMWQGGTAWLRPRWGGGVWDLQDAKAVCALLPMLVFLALEFYGLLSNLCLVSWSRGAMAFAALLLFSAPLAFPHFISLVLLDHFGRDALVREFVGWLAAVSPIGSMLVTLDEGGRLERLILRQGRYDWCWVFHGVFCLLLWGFFARQVRRRGRQDALPPDPPEVLNDEEEGA